MAGACSFKIDAVVDYLLRQTEKVVVFAYHRGLIEEYADKLRQAGRGVVILTGDNTKQTARVVESKPPRALDPENGLGAEIPTLIVGRDDEESTRRVL
jgi:hypothetical protein